MRLSQIILFTFALAITATAGVVEDAQAAFESGDYARCLELIEVLRGQGNPPEGIDRFEGVAQNALGAQMAEEERWGESLRALGEANRLLPDDEVVAENLNRIRLQAAVHMAERFRRHREALLLIGLVPEEVPDEIDMMRRDARVHIALIRARESAREGQRLRQRQHLEAALEWNADSIPALVDLGEWHYAQGDYDDALVPLRRAYQLDTDQGHIHGLINTIRRDRDATSEHVALQSDHFDVLHPGEQTAEFTNVCLFVLEQTHERLREEFEHTPRNRIPVVIYSQDQFQGVFLAPDWARAAYDGKLRIVANSIASHDERRALQDTLSHELTHAFVSDLTQGCTPIWLDEGLAQMFEHNHRLTDIEAVMLRQMKEDGELVSITDLPDNFATIGSTVHAQEAYLEALSFTEFLMRRFGGPRIRDMLALLGQGCSTEEAFENELGESLESLDRQWRASL